MNAIFSKIFFVAPYFSEIKFFCILSVLFFAQSSNAQNPSPPIATNFHQWGAVTLFNGLPSDNVRAIAQTPDGLWWFGTDNNLARFDGRRVQTFALENGEANKIFALKVAADGNLWIGTQNGAMRFKNGKFEYLEATRNFSITSILFGENVFLATANGVILKLTEPEQNNFRVEKIPDQILSGSDGQPLSITSLAQAGDKIVAGTRSRHILQIENNQAFESFSRPRPFFVNALAQDQQGNFWLGADSDNMGSGFFAFGANGNLQKIGVELGNVLSIAPDKTGGVWVGTQNKGLFYFRGNQQREHFTFESTAGGLRSNTIFTLFIDRENVVWVGTNRGVCRFDSSSPFNQSLAENANSNFVRTIFKTGDGQIFAGTNRGLFSFSGDGWIENEKFSTKTIYAIGEDSSKQILVASPIGLFGLDGKPRLTGDSRAVANFQGKTYAAIFERGIVQIENQTQILVDSPTALFADAENLWIGTARNGVFLFDGKTLKEINALGSLRGAAVWKIIGSGNEKDLWIATARGLFLYQNGQLQNVVANQDVRDVIITDAGIWAATAGDGLLHLKRDLIFDWIFANLNVEQGLPSQKIFSMLPVENHLLIGTNRGVVNYVPSAVAPQIVAVRVLSRRLHEADELTQIIALDYPQNSLLVEVAGLSSRTFPEQFQYGFLLKNAEGEIIEKRLSNDSQFAPANLPAGEYTIEVRGFNKDLLASEPLIIRFSVARAPFPKTATALGVLLAIALIGLIWAIIERRRIGRKNVELAAARFDLANEAERERKRIARDLHDQTLADLRSLMMMSDELPADNAEFRAEIETISTEIRRICEDLSPSVLENIGLVAALEFLLSQTIENYKFSAAGNPEENSDFSPNTQMQIYRVAQEVLTNIKRHSQANFVEMKVDSAENGEFVLAIEDDGNGFQPLEKSSKGRGISNIKSRAALIEAEVEWHSNETGGTRFLLLKNR